MAKNRIKWLNIATRISAYRRWKSVTIIQFRTNTKYRKLTESNKSNTQVRFTKRSEV